MGTLKVTEFSSQRNRSWDETVGRRWHRVPNKTLTGMEVERRVNFPAFIRTLLEHSSGHQTSDKMSQRVTCNVNHRAPHKCCTNTVSWNQSQHREVTALEM